jgi:hypothetical protein
MTARNLFIAAVTAAAMMPLASLPAAGAAKKSSAADAAAQSETMTAPLLRDAITVNDKMVYLGDLFINVGDKADAVVAYARRRANGRSSTPAGCTGWPAPTA